MDYPQLNFLFSLALIFTVVVNIGLRLLLSKVSLPVWLSLMSWIALTLSILSAKEFRSQEVNSVEEAGS
jgi:hypothetical protein